MSDNSKRDQFVRRIAGAPDAAKGFFETVRLEFERRNDCEVHYTGTDGGDMRVRAFWLSASGRQISKNFATLNWQPRKKTIFTRVILNPRDLVRFNFSRVQASNTDHETAHSKIYLDEDYWRFRVDDFIQVMELARKDMVGA